MWHKGWLVFVEFQVSYCLLFLFREREETIRNENRDNEENRNTIMPSSTNQTEQPSLNAASDEEFYSCSMSLDSEGKQKMAEFDGRANQLKAQFPEDVDGSANKNFYSSVSNSDVKESDEESSAFADERSAITLASDAHLYSEDSSLSSCKQEAPDIKDDVLSVISEEEETGDGSPKDVTKVPVEKGFDVKSADGCMELTETNLVHDSITSVSELSSYELTLSSCDQEVADMNNGMLFVSSEDEDDDPDSWDALDDITLPCCRSGKCTSCLSTTAFPCEIDDGLVAAVENISKHRLQRETLNAFKAAPLVQNAREFSGSNAKCMAEERHSDEEKLQVSLQKVEERNKALKEIVNFTNRENEKLMDQVIAVKEEAKTFKMEKESLQSDLETVKLEVKRLKDNEEYKERELSNLRDDIRKKGRKLKDVKEELGYARMDKNYLLYDIDLLKEKLKESEERSEELNFRVDELNITIKELETTTTYGHLREEVELSKGSLDLRSKHHDEEEDFNTSRDENAEIISRHKQQVIFLATENSRLKAELSKISDKEKDEQLREMKSEQEKVITQLRDQMSSAEQGNSRFIELKAEQDRIIKQLRVQLAAVEQDNSELIEKLNAETLRVSQKEEQLSELKEEQARTVEKLQEQLVCLDSEQINFAMKDQEAKANQLCELKMKHDKSRIRISRLESEKRIMEECTRDYKEKVIREINRLKQALKASDENNTSFQSRIESAKQEKCELRWENQKLKAESLQKYLYEMAQSLGVDVSSRPLMVKCFFTI